MSRLAGLLGTTKRTIQFGGSGVPFSSGPEGFFPVVSASFNGDKETIGNDFESYVGEAYKANGIVYACVAARALPFSEARFQYQALSKGRPGDLFGGPALSLLERPWANGTTGELLIHAMQDADLAGNFYLTRIPASNGRPEHLFRLRPDWVTIITADPYTINARIVGYVYKPAAGQNRTAVLLAPEQVLHWSPMPDPTAQWRGMSWLTPIIREIVADSAATKHKERFYVNGALSNLVVTYDKGIAPALFKESVQLFNESHQGSDNAWKTIHLGGGMDAKVLSQDLKSIDFKAIQGAGETRIAAAAGVGAIIGRFSEGMAGSSLNQGNYAAAKRQFADMTLRPLWRSIASALEKFASVPSGARLWPDTRDIAFLKEDEKDKADIRSKEATTIEAFIRAGFEPASAVAAVNNDDISLLKHTGMVSVQLHDPSATPMPDMGPPAAPAPPPAPVPAPVPAP